MRCTTYIITLLIVAAFCFQYPPGLLYSFEIVQVHTAAVCIHAVHWMPIRLKDCNFPLIKYQ